MSDVLIITLNYNQNEHTLKCINSILGSKYVDFKILLVDNGSIESKYTALINTLPKNDKIILHRIEENRGYVGGINYGLVEGAKLKPKYYLIMNNDTIIHPYAIKELVNTCIDYKNRAIVTGKVYDFDNRNTLQLIGLKCVNKNMLKFQSIGVGVNDIGQYDKTIEMDLIDDIYMLMPNTVYKDIGSYSNYFWFNGEIADYLLRAMEKGYKLIYTHRARLWHKGSASFSEGRNLNPKLAFWHIQGALIFRYLHQKRYYFFLTYIKYFFEISASLVKSMIDRRLKKKSKYFYKYAKFRGFLYFNKWLIIKNTNTGYNPFQ